MKRTKGCSSVPPPPKPYPWLMFSHGRHSQIQTFYSILENRWYMRKLLDLCGKEVVCASCKGWMVVLDNVKNNPSDCFLLNLGSMEKIKLPPLRNFDYKHGQFVLSSPPTKPNCILAHFRPFGPPRVVFWRPGQEDWIEKAYTDQENDVLHSVAVCDGKFYGLVRYPMDFAVLEMVDDDINQTRFELRKFEGAIPPIPYERCLPEVYCSNTFLIECNGDFFRIFQAMRAESATRTQDFSILKFNMKTLDWEAIYDIGDHAFFFSEPTISMSCCCASELGFRRNFIYYTQQGDASLYVFDIKKKTIYSSIPCPNVIHNLS